MASRLLFSRARHALARHSPHRPAALLGLPAKAPPTAHTSPPVSSRFISNAGDSLFRAAEAAQMAAATSGAPRAGQQLPRSTGGGRGGTNLGAMIVAGTLLLGGVAAGVYYQLEMEEAATVGEESVEQVANWSGTHVVDARMLARPESLEELEAVVREAHASGQKLRPLGSGISPNGLGLSSAGMVSLAHMDRVLQVDAPQQQVTVQAGARVEQVVEALRPHGLTLPNYASVREQQIGGFIQVSAHGTGAQLPPVDEQVVRLKLVTPALGTLELDAASHPELFPLARCSLGTLGVVAEVTLQCVPAHQLREHTFVATMAEVRRNHRKWLQGNQHLRYMWIPYTDSVVVVRSNPQPPGKPPPPPAPAESLRLAPLRNLYRECTALPGPAGDSEASGGSSSSSSSSTGEGPEGRGGGSGPGPGPGPGRRLEEAELVQLSFTQLRDELLALDPLSTAHVERVNRAEEAFWQLSEGYRVGWSDEILGFDCGGQQWVSEVCFPAAPAPRSSWLGRLPLLRGREAQPDLDFMEGLLRLVRQQRIPAPAPIEQRWTAGSSSPMSPAASTRPGSLFSWVGIIMYLPTDVEEQRAAITKAFFDYKYSTAQALWDKYDAREHWAKIEVPEDPEIRDWLKMRLSRHFPLEALNKWRAELDPKGILSNDLVDELLPRPPLSEAGDKDQPGSPDQ